MTDGGKPCVLADGCSLHLHSYTSYAGRPNARMSAPNAVGLAAANGNTGDALGVYAAASVYVTTNAGVTWRRVRAGPHLYAFGDSGALLVIVNDADATDHVRYSWDYGQTWQYYRFLDSGKTMRVHSLTASLDASSERFLLLGELVQQRQAVAVSIDLTALHLRTCAAADFEDWSPSDATGSVCLLGHELVYKRRLATAACAIQTKFQDPVVRQAHCTCTAPDFECDLDYEAEATGGTSGSYTCVPAEGNGAWDVPSYCRIGTTYGVPSGYRRVPINTCSGGIDLTRPLTRACGSTSAPTTKPTVPSRPTVKPTATSAATPKPTASSGTPAGTAAAGTDAPAAGGSTRLSTVAIVATVTSVIAAVILLVAGLLLWRRAGGSTDMCSRGIRNIRYKAVRQEDIDTEEFLVDDY